MSKSFYNKSFLKYLILNNGSSFLIKNNNHIKTSFYKVSNTDFTNCIYISKTAKPLNFQNKKKHIINFRKYLF